MAITAADVKNLREQTGAGMMDCKKALGETNGDFEAAVDWLRAKGIAKAAKKAARVATEGIVTFKAEGTQGTVLEINAETDFVAKNPTFVEFSETLISKAYEISAADAEALASADLNGKTVSENLTDLIAKIGENMNLRRVSTLSVESGCVAGYSHMGGKIGVLVALSSDKSEEEIAPVAKQIAMHVAASNPQALDSDSLDPAIVERERTVLVEQAMESGKSKEIAEKMVEGRMKKFLKEICLVDQPFVMDTDKTVEEFAAAAGCKVAGFIRYGLGEGLEKKEDNFAEEVKAAAGL